jgi:hypothetical protein
LIERLAFGFVCTPICLLTLAAAVLDLMASRALLELVGGLTAMAAVRIPMHSVNHNDASVFFSKSVASWYGFASRQAPPFVCKLLAFQHVHHGGDWPPPHDRQ